MGFEALAGFYGHYDGEMTRNRFVAILLMPLVVISFVPLLVAAAAQAAWGWVAFISAFNGLCACAEYTRRGPDSVSGTGCRDRAPAGPENILERACNAGRLTLRRSEHGRRTLAAIQAPQPAGLRNVSAIAAGYLCSLALGHIAPDATPGP